MSTGGMNTHQAIQKEATENVKTKTAQEDGSDQDNGNLCHPPEQHDKDTKIQKDELSDKSPDVVPGGFVEEKKRELNPIHMDRFGQVRTFKVRVRDWKTETPTDDTASTDDSMPPEQLLDKKDIIVNKFVKHVESKGMVDVSDDIERQIMEYSKNKVNLGITGQSGMGKSSLINTLRSMLPTNKGAAAVGTTECTMDLKAYTFPDNPIIVLWDLPGVNTPNFPMKEYMKRVGLWRFDAIIICTSVRFSQIDLWLARNAHTRAIPFYLVRTKIDADIASAHEDYGRSAEDTLNNIRANLKQNLSKAELPAENLFLISCKLSTGGQLKYDFPKLNEKLIKNCPPKNIRDLVRALVTCSENIISIKYDQLEADIPRIAKEAAGKVAFSEHVNEHERVISEAVDEYFKWFGLNDAILEVFKIKIQNLDKALQNVYTNLLQAKLQEKKATGNFTRLLRFFGKKSKADVVSWGEMFHKKEEIVFLQADDILRDILQQCRILALGILKARKGMSVAK